MILEPNGRAGWVSRRSFLAGSAAAMTGGMLLDACSSSSKTSTTTSTIHRTSPGYARPAQAHRGYREFSGDVADTAADLVS